MELQQKIRRLQSKNDALQDTNKVLQNSCRDLEEQLESTQTEKLSCVERVSGFFYNCICCQEAGEPLVNCIFFWMVFVVLDQTLKFMGS